MTSRGSAAVVKPRPFPAASGAQVYGGWAFHASVSPSPGSRLPSTAIGQMRIRYFGRGLIKDNLQPGWVVRVLNKIF